jgi:hypothetical protein
MPLRFERSACGLESGSGSRNAGSHETEDEVGGLSATLIEQLGRVRRSDTTVNGSPVMRPDCVAAAGTGATRT